MKLTEDTEMRPHGPARATLDGYADAVQQRLDEVAENGPFPQVFEHALHALVSSRGKLIRPIVTLAAAELDGTAYSPLALDAAVAVESVHVCSLILDDIMDEAPLRRSSATLHTAYGMDVAIIVAGLLLLRGLRPLAEFKRMRRIGYECLSKLALGQALETRGVIQSEVDYVRMIELKTASLFEAAMALGREAGDRSAPIMRAALSYGRSLGMAFQIRDDVLDFVSDTRMLGKASGNDLRLTKPTIVTLGLAERLGRSTPDLTVMGIDALRSLPEAEEVIEAADALTREHSARAVAALSDLPDSPAKASLMELALDLASRQT